MEKITNITFEKDEFGSISLVGVYKIGSKKRPSKRQIRDMMAGNLALICFILVALICSAMIGIGLYKKHGKYYLYDTAIRKDFDVVSCNITNGGEIACFWYGENKSTPKQNFNNLVKLNEVDVLGQVKNVFSYDGSVCVIGGQMMMVYCFGKNAYGRIGLRDSILSQNYAVLLKTQESTVLTNVVSVEMNDKATCVQDSYGYVFCAGKNDNGELGCGIITEDVDGACRVLTPGASFQKLYKKQSNICMENRNKEKCLNFQEDLFVAEVQMTDGGSN